LAAHQDDSRGAVVEARRVSCGHCAILGKGWLQLGERVERRARTDIFIQFDDNVALLAADCEGDDFFLKPARLLRRFGLVLRGECEFVLLVAAQLPFRRDILGRLPHVIAVENVGQAVANHGVDEFEITHLAAAAQMGAMLRQRHALLAAGDHDFGIAIGDLLHSERYRAQA
jgi:hypothetical protein